MGYVEHQLSLRSNANQTSSSSEKEQYNSSVVDRVFKVIYTLAKVRGYKTVIKFFPHEVAHLEPVLQLLVDQNQVYDSLDRKAIAASSLRRMVCCRILTGAGKRVMGFCFG